MRHKTNERTKCETYNERKKARKEERKKDE